MDYGVAQLAKLSSMLSRLLEPLDQDMKIQRGVADVLAGERTLPVSKLTSYVEWQLKKLLEYVKHFRSDASGDVKNLSDLTHRIFENHLLKKIGIDASSQLYAEIRRYSSLASQDMDAIRKRIREVISVEKDVDRIKHFHTLALHDYQTLEKWVVHIKEGGKVDNRFVTFLTHYLGTIYGEMQLLCEFAAYIDQGFEEIIERLRQMEATDGWDREVRTFARRWRPTLERQLGIEEKKVEKVVKQETKAFEKAQRAIPQAAQSFPELPASLTGTEYEQLIRDYYEALKKFYADKPAGFFNEFIDRVEQYAKNNNPTGLIAVVATAEYAMQTYIIGGEPFEFDPPSLLNARRAIDQVLYRRLGYVRVDFAQGSMFRGEKTEAYRTNRISNSKFRPDTVLKIFNAAYSKDSRIVTRGLIGISK